MSKPMTLTNDVDAAAERGVLLVNLGSPDSFAVADVRRYLDQFLMDGRVIDSPFLIRWLVVKAFILPLRPKQSAAAYQSIWWEEGSPLIVLSRRLQEKVQAGLDLPVALGMRYGQPSIAAAVQELLSFSSLKEILLIPLYPHYAMSTYETVVVEVQRVLQQLNGKVALRLVPPFYDDPDYIAALVQSAQPRLQKPYDHLLFSYHGVPERHLHKTDPTRHHCLRRGDCCELATEVHHLCYRAQVVRTTRAFAEAMKIPADKYSIAFQSRLGRDPWLTPYTDQTIVDLAESGVKHLRVICPAFVADCLETLEEIGEAGRELFLHHGGESFELIPCLNDHPQWVTVLQSWARRRDFALPPLVRQRLNMELDQRVPT